LLCSKKLITVSPDHSPGGQLPHFYCRSPSSTTVQFMWTKQHWDRIVSY